MLMKFEEMEEYSGFLYDHVQWLTPLFFIPGLMVTLFFINYEVCSSVLGILFFFSGYHGNGKKEHLLGDAAQHLCFRNARLRNYLPLYLSSYPPLNQVYFTYSFQTRLLTGVVFKSSVVLIFLFCLWITRLKLFYNPFWLHFHGFQAWIRPHVFLRTLRSVRSIAAKTITSSQTFRFTLTHLSLCTDTSLPPSRIGCTLHNQCFSATWRRPLSNNAWKCSWAKSKSWNRCIRPQRSYLEQKPQQKELITWWISSQLRWLVAYCL